MIEAVGTQADLLGEGPVWDPRLGRLYSVDIDGHRVNRFDPESASTESRRLDGRPGSLALTADLGTLLVAVEDHLMWLDWESGVAKRWLDLETGGPSNRLNDGAPDRDGRFWVGTMHEDAIEHTGVLSRVDPTGSVTVFSRDAGIPNGIAFSPDGATMFYADSLAKTVWAYDYDRSSGQRTAERVLTDFSDLPGFPDGGTVDEDGCYWIACVFGSVVVRLTPEGDVDRIIELPVDKPTKPAFGGADLGVLFVTSIGGGGSHPRYDEPGLNGVLLAIDVGVHGVPEPTVRFPG